MRTSYFYFFDNFAKWKQLCFCAYNLVTFLFPFPLSLAGIMPFKGRHRMISWQEDIKDLWGKTSLPAHVLHLKLSWHPYLNWFNSSKFIYLLLKCSIIWIHKPWQNLKIGYEPHLENVVMERTEEIKQGYFFKDIFQVSILKWKH